MNVRSLLLSCFALMWLDSIKASDDVPIDHIEVSENQRFLTHQGGKPFFYLGDTAWELFHRLDQDEAKLWQMYDHKKRSPINMPLMDWQDAIHQPGSSQMIHAKRLLLSRPYFTRIPATDQVLIPHEVNTAVPGRGEYRFVATADTDSTYILVYTPVGRAFSVRTSYIRGKTLKAWWFNPRTGKAANIGKFRNEGQKTFLSPTPGEQLDWILVIDDASKGYPKPGSKEYKN